MVIMSIDYGDMRTGVAVCDALEMLASPVTVIKESYEPKLIEKIKAVISEKKPSLIVVGKPKNMDGSEGFRAQKCTLFADKLRQETGVSTVMWDERLTTVSAHKALNETNTRGKGRKNVIDAVSAVMILEDFLRHRKNT